MRFLVSYPTNLATHACACVHRHTHMHACVRYIKFVCVCAGWRGIVLSRAEPSRVLTAVWARDFLLFTGRGVHPASSIMTNGAPV